MNRVFLEIKERNFISPSQAQQFLPSPPNIQSNSSFDLNSKISPSILLIIIILSIIFFLSGLLHLLVRFLLTPSNREQDEYDNVTALQGQLQQLFHLHDSGVDQSFIDTLPVFHYKSIIGLKNPFDCAVCLCEFEPEDKLRLLPKCSHAFHMDCIDTWLLSHSTCPLCRSSLLSNFSPQSNSCSPFVLVLESGSDSSREIATDCDSHTVPGNNSVHGIRAYPNSHLSCDGNSEFGSTHFDSGLKTYDFSEKEETFPESDTNLGALGEEKVVAVRLGKFRNVDDGGQCSNNANDVLGNRNIDERRCFSMGACEYVMEEESTLMVHVSVKNQKLHRAAMSECDGDSIDRFKFNEFGSMRSAEEQANGNVIEKNCRKESFSISKIWLKGDKKKHNSVEGSSTTSSSSFRRAFSFRFPVHTNSVSADSKGKNKPGSGEEIAKRENSESLETKTPSFARRAALWLVGRQNKVVHSSSAPFV